MALSRRTGALTAVAVRAAALGSPQVVHGDAVTDWNVNATTGSSPRRPYSALDPTSSVNTIVANGASMSHGTSSPVVRGRVTRTGDPSATRSLAGLTTGNACGGGLRRMEPITRIASRLDGRSTR